MTEPGTGWPFWAPSERDLVERALDLAQLRPGERFVDLGCGDGSVLVAAAERGAVVRGVESDAELASLARKNLAEAGFEHAVVDVGDVFEVDLSADVLFTYLSPATLQRLLPRLRDDIQPGTRLVTIDYTLTGATESATDDDERVHLYVLPPTPSTPERGVGWESAGLLVAAVPDHESLSVIELVHPGGQVRVTATADLLGAVDLATGVDQAEPGSAVAVDVRWAGYEAGTLLRGELVADGLPPLPVVAFYTDEDFEHLWELTDDGVVGITGWLDAGNEPRSFADLLAAAEGS